MYLNKFDPHNHNRRSKQVIKSIVGVCNKRIILNQIEPNKAGRQAMSFVVGLVIGLVVGLGLIVAFVRSENARSKSRSQLVLPPLLFLCVSLCYIYPPCVILSSTSCSVFMLYVFMV